MVLHEAHELCLPSAVHPTISIVWAQHGLGADGWVYMLIAKPWAQYGLKQVTVYLEERFGLVVVQLDEELRLVHPHVIDR